MVFQKFKDNNDTYHLNFRILLNEILNDLTSFTCFLINEKENSYYKIDYLYFKTNGEIINLLMGLSQEENMRLNLLSLTCHLKRKRKKEKTYLHMSFTVGCKLDRPYEF